MARPPAFGTPCTEAVPDEPTLFERCRMARWQSEVLRVRSRRAVAEARATVDEVRQLRFVRLLAADFPAVSAGAARPRPTARA